ncbi:hypothetical protein EJ04DRAFT_398333, partial [Polyplosphaeria fusca]
SVATLATIVTLTTPGSAFVVNIYDQPDCQGDAREVNVWDNTCANWEGSFRSFKPTVYGGTHQHAYFFTPGDCGSLPGNIWNDWADGGGGSFRVDQCASFDNQVANAIASWY